MSERKQPPIPVMIRQECAADGAGRYRIVIDNDPEQNEFLYYAEAAPTGLMAGLFILLDHIAGGNAAAASEILRITGQCYAATRGGGEVSSALQDAQKIIDNLNKDNQG